MTERLDIVLSGFPGSGKSTIGKYLQETYGFTQITGSDILRMHASKLGKLLVLREDYHDFYAQMRKEHGPDFIAQAGLEINQERVAHDGIRTLADMRRLIGAAAIPVAVTCDRQKRFERTAGTSAKYGTDIVEFAQADLLEDSFDELGPQVSFVMDEARHIIDNNGTYGQLYGQVDEIVDRYI